MTLSALVDWLHDPKARSLLPHELVAGLGERLARHVPVCRLSTGLRTMHPEIAVVSLVWTAEGGVQVEDMVHQVLDRELASGPIPTLVRSGEQQMRVRLDGPESDVPLLRRLQHDGCTDYLLQLLPGTRYQVMSYTTRAPGGFTEADLAVLEGLRMPLSLRLDLALSRHVTYSLLNVYLGDRTAAEVLAGNVQRGQGRREQVVVFTCDLRGFTDRVDRGPLEEVLGELDRYFECVSEPWTDAGGEVVKFVGDAVLGVLPLATPDAADRALSAVRTAMARLEAVSEELPEGRPPLRMGVVLHAGEVMYGNIGARRRIDFTVIGPCVNEASRLEKLTKTVAPLLLSEAFVEHLQGARVDDLGEHRLRGVAEPVRVFTVR
jgi:adenylate cyclase